MRGHLAPLRPGSARGSAQRTRTYDPRRLPRPTSLSVRPNTLPAWFTSSTRRLKQQSASFRVESYIHALNGSAVGQLNGTHVHRLDGRYVGELFDDQVVNMQAGNPGSPGNPGNRGNRGCPYPDLFRELLK